MSARQPLGGASREWSRASMADATLAAVVGAQDQDGVFQRDDEDQGPEHEREDAEHRAWLQGGVPARRFGGLLEGIERAGADITTRASTRAWQVTPGAQEIMGSVCRGC